MQPRKSPTAVDLFAGAGGATVGMKQRGFAVVVAVEQDPDAVATYRANHGDTVVVDGDIRRVEPLNPAPGLSIEPGSVYILNSCPPCQGFSSLHRGKDDDDRNGLVEETWRWASALKPEVVLLENVPGLRRHWRYHALVARLRRAGYGVRDWILDAQDLGAPQRRVRLFMVARRGISRRSMVEDLPGALPVSWIFERDAAAVLFAANRIAPAMSDPLRQSRKPSQAVLKRLRALPADGTRFDLPISLQLECHKRLGHRHATGSYARVPTTGPSSTLTTRCTTPACGAFVHPTEPRGLTLREAALLQTFPPDYAFSGNYQSIERQIGNAVPPRMTAAVIAAALEDH